MDYPNSINFTEVVTGLRDDLRWTRPRIGEASQGGRGSMTDRSLPTGYIGHEHLTNRLPPFRYVVKSLK